ncbi:LAETG motif-containing sortase-dependent surface protein [Kitasatospora sp. LaBMicrA B282]|uniref:LAETG motif-containing sortase-dependent surface protein n=1 Tax=Kitasatospora sp. LaBMicrA B282 TaxID=3420949 RepID=UPI003D09F87B
MHHPLRRTLPALAALGIAAAAPLLTAGPAVARDTGSCGTATVAYSVDNGAHWTTAGEMDKPYGVIQVKLVGKVTKGCPYEVSLASYSTEGPTWATSGTQAFLGWATTTLSSNTPQATLDVSGTLPPCFGQIDLYNNGNKFDGVSNPLPRYPDGVFPNSLISHWNGGSACAPTPTPTPTPTQTPVTPGKPSPSPSGSKTGSPSPSPTTGTPSPSASSSRTGTPSPSAGTGKSPSPSASATTPAGTAATTPAPGATDSAGPVGSSTVQPASTTPTGLAFTGTDGSQLVTYGVGGAVLVAAGAGAVVLTRRRNAHR